MNRWIPALAITVSLAACADRALAPIAPVAGDGANAAITLDPANLVQNGSFESPDVNGFGNGWQTFFNGNGIPGWTVGGVNGVDIHWGEFGQPWTNIPHGDQALDLMGNGAGATISQAIAGTVAGKKYKLTFYTSSNPACDPAVVSASLRFGTTVLGNVNMTTGYPVTNMRWDFHQFVVTASTNDAVLSFQGLTPTGCGLALDAIQIVAMDDTPPTITANVSGTIGDGGWYTDDVTVSFTVVENESALTTSGCETQLVSTDTQGVTYTCTASSEGGSAAATATVKRDATDPSIAFSPSSASYTVDQDVSITCSASDATSDLASSTCADVSAPAYTFALGGHALSASAKDNAGNTASAAATFTVSVTEASLCSLVRQWVGNAGVANSLCVKLKHKDSRPFVNEVDAQAGRKIPAGKAAILRSLGIALLD